MMVSFLDPYDKSLNIYGTQKGIIILTTTHVLNHNFDSTDAERRSVS